MRINSVTVRNCRLHRELKVEFDPSRTLIGGPNETGKSTLIEAMHRALFLKAKGNTECHRALISSLHPGHPEVELTFEAGGMSYHLKKRFGNTGTTTLAPSNSVLLFGDAAESELARLLSVEAGITGKAITIQWAHLWVCQGQACDDPSSHATAQQGGLLQRLQQIGGAAAVRSDLDARVVEYFTEAKDQIYTQAGKPKAGSKLEQSEQNVSVANEQLALARERVQKLDSSAGDLENASRDQLTAMTSLGELERQQDETETKARQLGELRQKEAEQSPAAKAANEQHSALESANRQILAARMTISELEECLKPQNEAVEQSEKSRDEAKSKAGAAEQAYRTATDAVRAARLRHELASAHTLQFEKTEVHAKLREKDKKVSKRRRDLAVLEMELAKLPKVDKTRLQKLHKLDSACSSARAALQAMSTGLEVIAADKRVKAGSRFIKIGEKQILTEDTEVTIGSAIRLRIQPGGGISLAEARASEEEARKDLQETLESFGFQSVQEAVEVNTNRDEHGSRIKAVQAELEGMGAENLADELQSAQNDAAAAKANLERLSVLAVDVKTPDDQTAAKALVKALFRKLSDAEDQETDYKALRDRSGENLEAAEGSWKAKQSEVTEQRNKLTGLKAELNLLLKTHGDDTVRTQALIQSKADKITTQTLLRITTDAIAALQPELLESDRIRIARAVKEKTNERNDARTQMAVAQAALCSDGSEDSQASLATAEAQARSASEHRNSVLRKAQAVDLLDRLFQEEQRSLSEQFTQPLADKISGYLQCIFGPGARAQVDLENNEFTSLRLSRPRLGDGPFSFDTLSGGAKEQTAAAVRLAMAEVLAANHGDCLPVVFDDAFAYSDPERVKQVQRMLDLAAIRGLQVIILTCNPADYASLGAKTIALRLERHVPSTLGNAAAGFEVESQAATSPDSADQIPPVASYAPVTDQLRTAFLDELSAFGGKAGNTSLREALGWDEATYNLVRNDLVSTGELIPGRGRGGSVCSKNP